MHRRSGGGRGRWHSLPRVSGCAVRKVTGSHVALHFVLMAPCTIAAAPRAVPVWHGRHLHALEGGGPSSARRQGLEGQARKAGAPLATLHTHGELCVASHFQRQHAALLPSIATPGTLCQNPDCILPAPTNLATAAQVQGKEPAAGAARQMRPGTSPCPVSAGQPHL